MKVSVMFITYNRKTELIRAIKSCIKNKMDEMEIVVVDNHSEDGTQNDVKEILAANQIAFQYKYLDENMGVAGGRNIAFKMCQGEYVFCLDDDAIIETNNFFMKMYTMMKSDLDAVAAAVEIFEPANDRYLKGFVFERNGQSCAHSFIGAAHVLKRDFFSGGKLYPERLKFGSEEAYIAYKIWTANKKMLYLNELRVLHLPSVVARVYGDERNLNIILNNHIIRKLCYPRLVCPILDISFRIRIWRHKLLKIYSYKYINQLMRERYDKSEEARMALKSFLFMVRTIGVKWTF